MLVLVGTVYCLSPGRAVAVPLDVDGDGVVSVATDIVYIERHLLGLLPVPSSFRLVSPAIPPDSTIAASIDALGNSLDVDMNGHVDGATDIVYIARYLLGLGPVPGSFRLLDPTIPPDADIAARIDALLVPPTPAPTGTATPTGTCTDSPTATWSQTTTRTSTNTPTYTSTAPVATPTLTPSSSITSTPTSTPTTAILNPKLVGFIPGVDDALNVAVTNGTAWVASDAFGLSVANVGAPSAPILLGSANVPFFGQAVAVQGTLAVVGGKTSAGLAHLWVLDLTNSTQPTVVGELSTTIRVRTGMGFLGVALNSSATLAVTAMGASGLWVVDLSTPANPTVLSTYTPTGISYAVALDSTGTLAYVAAGSGHLQIVNLSNPQAPALAGSLSMSNWQIDVGVAGSLAYLLDSATLRVINVSNPAAPTVVASLVLPRSGFHLAVNGSRAALLSNDSSYDYLDLIDCSNPATLVLTGSVVLGNLGIGQGVAIESNTAYVAANSAGLQTYDVSTTTPVLLGSLTETFVPQSIAGNGTVAMVIGDDTLTSTLLLEVLDVSIPAHPVVVGKLPTSVLGNNPSGVAFTNTGTMAVAALGTAGISLVDLTVPAAPVVLGTFPLPGVAQAVALDSTATFAYVAAGSGHLQIVDISNPQVPTLAGSLSLSGWQIDVGVAGSFAYLLDNGSLQVIDVSNPAQPALVGVLTPSRASFRIAVNGPRAALVSGDENNDYLDLLDLSMPTEPGILGSAITGPPGTGQAVALGVNNEAYEAGDNTGLQIYDASGTTPVLLTVVHTVGNEAAIAADGTQVYLADFPGTISIVSLFGP